MTLEEESLRAWAADKTIGAYRTTCPFCSDQRTNRTARCLSATVESEKILWQCWHCGKSGAISLVERYEPPKSKPKEPGVVKSLGTSLDPASKIFLKGRGVSEETATIFGAAWASAYFPDLGRVSHALAFPYYKEAKAYGHKLRATDTKANVCQPALNTLFGIQLVDLAESPDIVIVEGEIDCLSMYEAKVLNAVSVPNGASSFTRSNEGDERATMGFLWSAKDKLDKAKRIIIAVDNDDPGDKLASELSRRIGRHRCWQVKFPEGCKDANDVLLKCGADKLKEIVSKAEPWPIEGLYEANKFFDRVIDLYSHGFGDRIITGLKPVDEIYSVGKGLLTIITGVPGMGKSTFVDMVMMNLAKQRRQVFGICSFENPPHVHIGKLLEMYYRKHFFQKEIPGERMTGDDVVKAMPFINNHFKFLQQDDGKKATFESIIERIKTAVFRWGINGIVIDPFNYIARPKGMDKETEWIDDMLTQLRLTAVIYDLHIWMVAHPTKMQMDHEGNYPPPRGFSISGSAAWYSKADFGLTVHKVGNGGLVRVINWKTRYSWLGKEGEAQLTYDSTQNVYLDDIIADARAYYHPHPDDEVPF